MFFTCLSSLSSSRRACSYIILYLKIGVILRHAKVYPMLDSLTTGQAIFRPSSTWVSVPATYSELSTKSTELRQGWCTLPAFGPTITRSLLVCQSFERHFCNIGNGCNVIRPASATVLITLCSRMPVSLLDGSVKFSGSISGQDLVFRAKLFSETYP